MKKAFSKSLSWLLSVVMIFGVFIVPTSIQVSATQSRKDYFNKNYSVVSGDPGQTIVNIAKAQIGKTGNDLPYGEDWCADFVSDCADLAGQSAAVPRRGNVDDLTYAVIKIGGGKQYWNESEAKPGDLVFYDGSDMNGSPNHVEIVAYVSGGKIYSIGGNTGNIYSCYNSVVSNVRQYYPTNRFLYFIRPNYKIEHTHNYTEYIFYEAAHPHYKCYKCNCGDIKANHSETVALDTCADCLADYKATLKLDKNSYQVGDAVTVSWNKIDGATHYNLWIYRVKSDGTSELVSRNDEIKSTKFTLSNLSSGKYYTYFQTYNSNYWMHDNSDWFHSQADRVYFEIKLPTYTIFYNMNGGSGSIANQSKTYGQDLTLSSTKPTRTGYNFLGWNTNKDATTAQYQAGGKYTANSGATLYAIWKINTWTVSYNMNGGSGSIANQTKTYGQDLTLSSTKPTRTGYDFLGWNTNKDATTAQYSAGGKYTANSGATLYAIWKSITYTVSYNMNGGSGSIGNQTKTYGQDLTLSSTKPTRTGYDFLGWNTNKDATTAQYSAGGKYTANSGATLYAIWKINTWIVSYNMNGGSGSIANQTKTYGQDLTLSSTKPTRTGYDFVGWNTNKSATTAQYQAGGKYTANSGATLYAIWKDSSKPTITNATITKVSNKGYRVNCNVGDNVGVTKVQIKVWTEKNGQDDVVLHNGSVSNGLVTAYIETSKHNNETGNYITEIYAYDNAGNSNVIKANNIFVSNEPQKIKTIDYNNHTYIVYVADKSWTDAKTWCEQNGGYLVTVTDESEWNKVKELLGGINGAPAWLGAESTSGSWKWVTGESLTFSNWIKGQPDNAGKKEFYLSTAYEGLNCYGWNDWENSASQVGAFVYERVNTYTITYDMNGGSGSVENQTKTYGQDLTLSSTKPTRTGYEFIGWNTNSSATSAQYQPNDKYTTNSGATLYAVWKKLAENTPQIIVENKTASAGSEVKVNVSLKNNPGVSSMGLTLKYDKTKLTLKAVNYNSAMGGQSMQPQTMDSPVILNWVSPVADYSGDGTYAELVFKVLDNAEGGTTPIEITYNSNNIYNLKDENIAFAVKNGTVTVRDYIPGDINNDGVVNNKDFSRLFQYLSGWNVVVNEVALDVNGDGSVNNKDATRLFQYVSGWNVNIY